MDQFENKISKLAIRILFQTFGRSIRTTWRCSIWRNKKIANLKRLVLLLDMELPHQCRGRLHWTPTCLIRHPPTYSSGLSGLSWMSANRRFARGSHARQYKLDPISVKTLKKYLFKAVKVVEKRNLPRQRLRLVMLLDLMAGLRPQNISIIPLCSTLPRNMMPIL